MLDRVMQARERVPYAESPQGGVSWRGVSRERGGASTCFCHHDHRSSISSPIGASHRRHHSITTYAECASHIQRETGGQSSVHHHQTLNHIVFGANLREVLGSSRKAPSFALRVIAKPPSQPSASHASRAARRRTRRQHTSPRLTWPRRAAQLRLPFFSSRPPAHIHPFLI